MQPHIAQLLAVAILAIGCGRSEPKVTAKGTHNVVVVVMDTTRLDAISAHRGDERSITPVYDELAKTGVLYDLARAPGPWTVPSHASLLTGKWPHQHRAQWGHTWLATDNQTLAEYLAPSHDTAGFSENPHIGHSGGFDQGFEAFGNYFERMPWQSRRTSDQHLRDWLEARTSDEPAFVFVNLMTPHLPYQPYGEHLDKHAGHLDPETIKRMWSINEAQARDHIAGASVLSPSDLAALRALYEAEVAATDAQLGGILEMLESSGILLDETLLVVTSDHGENIGEHGMMEHQLGVWETLVRVPLLVRLPGAFDGGRRVDRPVSLVDVVPTVLTVLEHPHADSEDLAGQTLTATPPASRPVFAEYARPTPQGEAYAERHPTFDFSPWDRALQAVIVGSDKYVRSSKGEEWLYDLATDPAEAVDLAATEPQRLEELRALLEDFDADRAITVKEEARPEIDAEVEAALKELGYIE